MYLLLVKNDKALHYHHIHIKKLFVLTKSTNSFGHYPNKVQAKYKLSKENEPLSLNVLQSAVPPTKVEYTYFMMPFKLLLRDVQAEKLPSKDFTIVNNKRHILHLLHILIPKVVKLNQILLKVKLKL